MLTMATADQLLIEIKRVPTLATFGLPGCKTSIICTKPNNNKKIGVNDSEKTHEGNLFFLSITFISLFRKCGKIKKI